MTEPTSVPQESTEDANNKKRQAPDELTPITVDGDMPQKKFYRQRAHCNPLSHNDAFEYPIRPTEMDWTPYYPENNNRTPTVLDIGCGFGGLTVALANLLPNETVLGMEIRAKVTEYVRLRIVASRKEHPGKYQNCSVMRTNSMKFLTHYFPKASLSKLFFCFPDPHFKRKNHGRRIVSERLLSEYAYALKPKGRLYCITDVKELHEWHVAKCDAHPLFRNLAKSDENGTSALEKEDPCIHAMKTETEESKKVDRNKGSKYYAVYERVDNSELESPSVKSFWEEL
eukprot:Nitzschia sp. Nitz4//scaffold362_size15054//13434//14288//NITZ4_008903-RA/size15054-processed-gene-0.3-mRNA-1//1//CDS//3329549253//1847//frame0